MDRLFAAPLSRPRVEAPEITKPRICPAIVDEQPDLAVRVVVLGVFLQHGPWLEVEALGVRWVSPLRNTNRGSDAGASTTIVAVA